MADLLKLCRCDVCGRSILIENYVDWAHCPEHMSWDQYSSDTAFGHTLGCGIVLDDIIEVDAVVPLILSPGSTLE